MYHVRIRGSSFPSAKISKGRRATRGGEGKVYFYQKPAGFVQSIDCFCPNDQVHVWPLLLRACCFVCTSNTPSAGCGCCPTYSAASGVLYVQGRLVETKPSPQLSPSPSS